MEGSGGVDSNREDLPVILPPAASSPATQPIAGVFPTLGEPLWSAIRSRGFRHLALQVPAGLVRGSAELAQQVSSATGAKVSLVNRACFGACDLPSADEVPGAEAIVALGHSPIPNIVAPLPMFFVEMRLPAPEIGPLAEQLAASALPRKLGLVASVQHLDLVEPLRAALGRAGFSIPLERGDRRLAYAAQALGCNYSSSEAVASQVDAFLFLGTGRFHPLGLALATARPVWSFDPLQRTLEPPIDREELVGRRLLYVAKARDARRWGILVSSFVGQHRPAMAEALRRRAEAAGREAVVIVFTRLDGRDLEGRAIDAYVNTACPRIATDDAEMYEKPILTPPEFLMALGELPMTEYRFDTFR
ncbi:MAG TPA: diphthamide biosynthesis enzyme Dph2 [Thermoplasmata archaeon]|nr:diphthamide biosynthesis enzyme Dph2 [Thermoplasmata archaeon]